MQHVSEVTGEALDKAEQQLPIWQATLDAWDKSLQDKGWNTLKKPDESSTTEEEGLTATIQGLTEETGNLLASYINAIRADVSAIRELMTMQYPEDAVPINNNISLIQLDVMQIQANTFRSANAVDALYALMDNVTKGTKKLYVA